MTEFEQIVIGHSAIPALILSVLLMTAIPVIFFCLWRKKHKAKTRVSWLLAGAAGFLVSARILELGVHYFCIIADNPVSRFINGNTAAYVLYGITMAGVFEECGRYVMIRYVMKKNRTRENAVLYGIGHGGIEIWAVILPAMITYLAIAILFVSRNTENALAALKITEETAAAALPSVQAAASFDYVDMVMNVIERLLAMFLHIGLTVIVYYGVCAAKKKYLAMAVLLHMLADTFPALYQRGALTLWMSEIWLAFWTAAIVCIAVKLYRTVQ